MLALGIRYLNDFAAASEPDARDRPEWPPHPARVFMALAAAYFQTGAEPREREALLWLEQLPPPSLRAHGASPRKSVTHYVPVNDEAGNRTKPPTAVIQSAPQLARDRQPRTFARAWTSQPVVYLVWPEVMVDQDRLSCLASLCAKVTRIGHSTSLVQMWVARPEEVGEVTWIPDDARAEIYLRVTTAGTLHDLERRYNAEAVERYARLLIEAEDEKDKARQRFAKAELREKFAGGPPPRLRPQVTLYQGYARPLLPRQQVTVAGTVFSPHIVVFELEQRSGPFAHLGLQAAASLIQRWREALLSECDEVAESVRAIVSGHDQDGRPLDRPHLALIPLAFLGHPHADGHLLGLAGVLPTDLPVEDRRGVLQVLRRVGELRCGPLGIWGLIREIRERPPLSLRPDIWTAHPGGERLWATVTPVAFDRHPKQKDPESSYNEVVEMIATACMSVGLPRPREVVTTPVSPHLGAPPAFVFPRLPRKDGGERRHTHAILIFDQPVRGPVLIGAGRYRGYGVCRPLKSGFEDS